MMMLVLVSVMTIIITVMIVLMNMLDTGSKDEDDGDGIVCMDDNGLQFDAQPVINTTMIRAMPKINMATIMSNMEHHNDTDNGNDNTTIDIMMR